MATYHSNEDAWRADAALQYINGQTSRNVELRNPGLFGVTPTEFDPSNIGILGAVDGNGEYTVTMSTGTTATTPATGASWVWSLPSATGGTISAAFLQGFIRVYATGMATSSPLRWWAVVMDTSDPTTARGWGAYGAVESGSTDHLAGVIYTTSAGTWGATLATTSTGQGWVEAVYATGRSNVPNPVGARRTLGGGLPGGASSQLATPTPTIVTPDFSSGAWLCIGFGSSTTGLAAGDYTIRVQSGLVDFDPTDAVGVGLT